MQWVYSVTTAVNTVAKLAIATGHAMQTFNEFGIIQTFRNVLSLTYLDAGLLA